VQEAVVVYFVYIFPCKFLEFASKGSEINIPLVINVLIILL